MSLYKALGLMCDGGKTVMCDNEFILTGDEATMKEVWRQAAKAGWTKKRKLHLCPEHKES